MEGDVPRAAPIESDERPERRRSAGWNSFRRVAAILATFAFVVPLVPHFVGIPYDPHRGPVDDGRAECIMLSAGSMGVAFVVACFGARGADRRTYWPNVAAVGLGWTIALACLPFGW